MIKNDSIDLPYRQFVKPRLAESLAVMGLDVTYHRAQGNYVYATGASGEELEILDMVGGNGSLLFGHNHPRVIAAMRDALGGGMLVHGQLSIRREAGLLAETLSQIARRDTGIDEDFVVHFANSGAEAIECALKHAEVTRMARLTAVWDPVRVALEALQRSVGAGEITLPDGQLEQASIATRFGRVRSAAELVDRVIAYNRAQLTRPPLFVALEQAFHGRLVASVQLTHAASVPYRNLGLSVRFLPPNDLDALEALRGEVARDHTIALCGLEIAHGAVRVVEHQVPAVGAVLIEPIQGEAGVLEVSREFGAAVRRFCDAQGCPLIIDEIQSGMGRTGRFFAASALGVQGDYYTLAKSLGAGVAKISAILFRGSLYQQDFALHHSSTFAEDDLSCRAARTGLAILEQDDGAAYRQISAMGARLRAVFDRLHEAFPDVIQEVRGRGLFLALDFAPPVNSGSPLMRTLTQYKLFGYLLAGCLLHSHKIRIAPTGSAPNLLRFHPSMFLDAAAIEHIEVALRRLCDIVRNDDVFHLIFPLTGAIRPIPRTEIRDFRTRRSAAVTTAGAMTMEAFRETEPALRDLTDGEAGAFLSRLMVIASRVGSLQHRRL